MCLSFGVLLKWVGTRSYAERRLGMFLAALLPFAGTQELLIGSATIGQSPNILLPRHLSSIVDHLWVGFRHPVRRASVLLMSAASSVSGVSVRLLGVHGLILLEVTSLSVTASL